MQDEGTSQPAVGIGANRTWKEPGGVRTGPACGWHDGCRGDESIDRRGQWGDQNPLPAAAPTGRRREIASGAAPRPALPLGGGDD